MPEEFDPAWEYWEPDEEIANPEVFEVDRFSAEGVNGFGFASPGRGLNYTGSSLGREKPTLKASCKVCGDWFDYERGRVPFYCSDACRTVSRTALVFEVICVGCGGKFDSRNPDRKFCTPACYKNYVGWRGVRNCARCATEFPKTNSRRAFCSEGCRNHGKGRGAERRLADKVCGGCGKTFRPSRNSSVSCSLKCRSNDHKLRSTMHRPKLDDVVLIVEPNNPAVHGREGIVVGVEAWGCVLMTAATAFGRFRATWDEMLPVICREPTGEVCKKCGGANLVRTGSCKTCQDCGENEGCS